MKTLSTGAPSTLGSYHDLCSIFFGEQSKATLFIVDKIEGSPNGRDEEVIADQRQMLNMLANLHMEDGDSDDQPG